VTCYTQPCNAYKVIRLLHYLPLRDESSPRGGWGICAPALPEVLTLGHEQPETPLRTDNSTAYGILNETIKQKWSKSMDIKYCWLQDRVRQTQFDIYWRPGKDNLVDYHTEHHPAQHHQDMRPILLNQANSLNVLRGCAKLP
jgi:hypothetical protein